MDPVVALVGNVAHAIPRHPVSLAVGVEKADHALRLLKGLDQPVQQKAIEAPVPESDAILVVLVEGVEGNLQRSGIPGSLAYGRLLRVRRLQGDIKGAALG